MGFDLDKIQQIKNEKLQSRQVFDSNINNAFAILTSKVLSYISSEDFENRLQAILEQMFQDNRIYFDDDNKAILLYNHQLSIDNNVSHVIIRFYTHFQSSGRYLIDVSFNELKLNIPVDYEKVVKYFDDNVRQIIYEIDNKFSEQLSSLNVKTISYKHEDTSRNVDKVVYNATDGKVII